MKIILKVGAVSAALAFYFVAHYCDLKRNLGLPTHHCTRYCPAGHGPIALVRL